MEGDQLASSSGGDPKDAMFNKILSNKSAFFKMQQIGEDNLTMEEKRIILERLFADKPSVFLSRYANLLDGTDVRCFASLQDDYEVGFYLKMVKERSEKGRTRTKNRRFAAMKRLELEGEFFSDEEMKERDPLLYDQMVGKYITNEEHQVRAHDATGAPKLQTLSGMFSDFADNHRIAEKRRAQQTNEKLEHVKLKMMRMRTTADRSGSQSSSESEQEDDDDSGSEEKGAGDEVDAAPKITEQDRIRLREEFGSMMRDRFVEGADYEYFDYDAVDHNSEYDQLDLIDRDAQDSYFDDDGDL